MHCCWKTGQNPCREWPSGKLMKGVRGERATFLSWFFSQSRLGPKTARTWTKMTKRRRNTSQGTLLDKIFWGFFRTSLYTFYYIKSFENEHLHRNSFLYKTNLICSINIVNIFYYLLSTSSQGDNSHFTELPMESCKIFTHKHYQLFM